MSVTFKAPSGDRTLLWSTGFMVSFAIASLALLLLAGGYAGLRINLTPSAPLGLWRIVDLERPVRFGDRVFVCPPLSAAIREAFRRGYLHKGLCPGFLAPLIKTVAAEAGQHVAVSDRVTIDGHPLPNSKLMAFDALARPLLAHPSGIVPRGQVYLHSDYPGSFDSRYFGPVPVANILGLAQEVLTHAP